MKTEVDRSAWGEGGEGREGGGEGGGHVCKVLLNVAGAELSDRKMEIYADSLHNGQGIRRGEVAVAVSTVCCSSAEEASAQNAGLGK